MNTLGDLLGERARNAHKGVVLIGESGKEDFLSYSDLRKRALDTLGALQAAGLRRGREVVFQIDDNGGFLIAFWACLLGGMIPVPVHVGTRREHRQKLLRIWAQLADPVLLIMRRHTTTVVHAAGESGLEALAESMTRRTLIWEDLVPAPAAPMEIAPDDIAFVQFSSGSTGEPKGVVLTHRNLLTNIRALALGTEAEGERDRHLSWMPLTHDMGLIGFHLTPLWAGTLHFIIPTDLFIRRPGIWLRKIAEHGVTISVSPNFGYRYLLKTFDVRDFTAVDLSSLRVIINGAEPISVDLCREFTAAMQPLGMKPTVIQPGYGLAEASLAVTIRRPGQEIQSVALDRRGLQIGQTVRETPDGIPFVCCGPEVEDSRFRLVDDQGRELPPAVIGHIQISGTNVTSGYYRNPSATHALVGADGWLYTGDVGFRRPEGLYVTGRSKEIVFVNGQNFYPQDIERAAEELSGIELGKIAVAGYSDTEKQRDVVLAFVVFKGKPDRFLPLARDLQHLVSREFGFEFDHVIPVLRLPKTTSGKVQRVQLREMYRIGEFQAVLQEITRLREELAARERRMTRAELQAAVSVVWRQALQREEVGPATNFFDLGGSSATAAQVMVRLRELTGMELPEDLLYREPTVRALTEFIVRQRPDRFPDPVAAVVETGMARNTEAPAQVEGIAVIGMAGRFPGADDVDAFWDNLRRGVESISFFRVEELVAEGEDEELVNRPDYVRAKGVVRDLDCFDAPFFRITPQEAEVMDPQVRIFLECAWAALENAGCIPEHYGGSIGVYAGGTPHVQWQNRAFARCTDSSEYFHLLQANDKDFLATQVSYKLDLRGPSFSLYTACSTSLVAVDRACCDLLAGRCDVALAGGVSVWLPEKSGYLYQEGMIYSSDGHCRVFDAKADGTLFSDGVGVMVLKPLARALADGDHVHAIIRGTAINNDGSRKIGYTAPSLQGQVDVIRAAQRAAGVGAETVSCIEAHGTGTLLGDPIELQALAAAFGSVDRGFCAVGSVKSNIGHLNTAAGVAGLIKTVLALEHRQIPPTLHVQEPNPRFPFQESPFFVNTTLREWPRGEAPRRAGVSAFGIGGTNAHVVVEEAPPRETAPSSRPAHLLTLSARTPEALAALCRRLAEHFTRRPETSLADAAFTLQLHRRLFPCRCSVAAATTAEAADLLALPREAVTAGEEPRPVVFMFSGQGTQYVNMGRELYDTDPDFRAVVDDCFDRLEERQGMRYRDALYPPDAAAADERLHAFTYSSPLKFIFDYAMARLLIRWGIRPAAMIGHSFGEYVAACLAGVISLDDALDLVAFRGRIMEEMAEGAMMSVPLAEAELLPLLGPELAVAAVNAPALCLVSGTTRAVEECAAVLAARGVDCLRLRVPRGAHSWMTEPILPAFREYLRRISFQPPRIPYVSAVTGEWITPEQATDPEYYVRHMRSTVRFAAGLDKILDLPGAACVQVGPGRELLAFVSQHPRGMEDHPTFHVVRHSKEEVSDWRFLLERVGMLWACGVSVSWNALYERERRGVTPLPSYPFARQKYNLDVRASAAPAGARRGGKASAWMHLPSWRPLPTLATQPSTEDAPCSFVLFCMETGFSTRLADYLAAAGGRVVRVVPGDSFTAEADRFAVCPGRDGDFKRLFTALDEAGFAAAAVVFAWSLSGPDSDSDGRIGREDFVPGFFSLLALFREIGAGGRERPPRRIVVLTRQAVKTFGDTTVNAVHAALIGPCRVFGRENPEFSCRMIDVAPPAPGSGLERFLLSALAAECMTESGPVVTAYRGRDRLEQVFTTVASSPVREHSAVRAGGVYLISGGLGGIGMVLAEHLARRAPVRLALIGRRPFPPPSTWEEDGHDEARARQLAVLREIVRLGSEVQVFQADITLPDDVRTVVDAVRQRWGAVTGVIHAAGLPDGGLIQQNDDDFFWRVMAPKIEGLACLRQCLGDEPEFWSLCSSLSSVVGPIGHAGYSAANCYLDAFAQQQSLSGRDVTSISWERWQDIGMGGVLQEQHRLLTGEVLHDGLTAAQGALAWDTVMAMGHPHVVVSKKEIAEVEQALRDLVNRGGESPVPAAGLRPRPALKTAYLTPRTPLENTLVEVWSRTFGIGEIGVRDDFFELGGDSLKAIILLSRVHQATGVKIPLADFFGRATVEKLAAGMAGATQAALGAIPRAVDRRDYPLSAAQRRIFILQQMNPAITSYNVPLAMEIRGEVHLPRLNEVLAAVLARHEVFRTTFHLVDGEARQRIHERCEATVIVLPAPDSTCLDHESWIAARCREFFQPFDLQRAPLLRLGLLSLEPRRHILFLDTHHIVCDGTSLGLLMGEITALYQGKELPSPPIRFRDFCEWQDGPEQRRVLADQERFWLEEFSDVPDPLQLPEDFPRPARQSFAGAVRHYMVEADLTARLKELAAREEATLFMALAAVYALFLSRLSGQDDIVVGTPVAGRCHPDVHSLVGMFANTLALRFKPAGNLTFLELLRQVKRKTLAAFENPDYPIEALVERVLKRRDPARNPLIDAAFILQNMSVPVLTMGEARLERAAIPTTTSKLDLVFEAVERDGGLALAVEYCSALFSPETIDRFFAVFREIVTAVVHDPAVELAGICAAHGVQRARRVDRSIEFSL